MHKESGERARGFAPQLDLEDDLRTHFQSKEQTDNVKHTLRMLGEKKLNGAQHMLEIERGGLTEDDPKLAEIELLLTQIKGILG